MPLDVSTLNQWIEERKGELITAPIELDSSFDYFDKVTNISGQQVKLPVIDVTPTADTNICGNNATATTSIKQFTIKTTPMRIEDAWCLQDLKKYFTTQWLPTNTEHPDTFAVLDQVITRYLTRAAKKQSVQLYLSDTRSIASGYPADLKAFDGVVSLMQQNVPAANQSTLPSGQTITVTNAINVFDTVISKLSTDVTVGDRPVLFCPSELFITLMTALRNANYFHYQYDMNVQGGKLQPFVYPGSNVLVVPAMGLNSNNVAGQITQHKQNLYATYEKNLVLAYNVSLDDYALWFSQDINALRIRLVYEIGVGVKFFNLVSEFHLTP
jgi:hypothetical protein